MASGTANGRFLGFDRRTNDYTMIGLDTLGTYYITAAGKHDDGAKGIVLDGSYAMPLLHFDVPGAKPVLVAETTLRRVR